MKPNQLNSILALSLLLVFIIACGNGSPGGTKTQGTDSDSKRASSNNSVKLDSYIIKGIKFAYFKIPAGLSREALIETAQKLHDTEADTQLLLVDNDSKVKDYIAYAKAISSSREVNMEMPKEWADKHIVANVQKYMDGRYVLCEGNGYKEIADLK